MEWSPASWRSFEARQQPDYPDGQALAEVERELATRPPLVNLAEVDALTAALAEAQSGRAFLIQGGDCAEAFDETQGPTVALLREMASAVAPILPVVGIGRVAGQYAKPRSDPLDCRGGIVLPAWRGDLINGRAFDPACRAADPRRMLEACDRAAATLAGLPVFASHEALLLPWEQALAREEDGRCYASSGHFLWIGDRTLFEGSAHVEFARGVANPLGLKCGPSLAPDALLRLIEALNPVRLPGRIALISRIGREEIERRLPPLIDAVARGGHPVLWVCDPMHGNTRRSGDGRKFRRLEDIEVELRAFFAITAAEGTWPGGLHVEMTGKAVSECGEPGPPSAPCDPRLNPTEAMRIAALAADELAIRWAAPRKSAAG